MNLWWHWYTFSDYTKVTLIICLYFILKGKKETYIILCIIPLLLDTVAVLCFCCGFVWSAGISFWFGVKSTCAPPPIAPRDIAFHFLQWSINHKSTSCANVTHLCKFLLQSLLQLLAQRWPPSRLQSLRRRAEEQRRGVYMRIILSVSFGKVGQAFSWVRMRNKELSRSWTWDMSSLGFCLKMFSFPVLRSQTEASRRKISTNVIV